MITIKPIILPADAKKTGECNVKIQIIKDGAQARIKTAIYVHKDNFKDGKVSSDETNWKLKNILITQELTKYEKIILDNLTELESLNVHSIKLFLDKGMSNAVTDFFIFTEARIAELTKYGKMGTVAPLANSLQMIKYYHKKPNLNFSEITVRFLEGFESYYLKKGHKVNSVAVYLRYIRSMFNEAIDEYNTNPSKPIIVNYPFRKFHIKTETTRNRNLDIEIIRKIRDYEAKNKREKLAQDIFMFQMYFLGVNMVDLFYLSNHITNGRIQFSRSKTGREYNIKVEPEALKIIDKYKGEKYLFWFADYCRQERNETSNKHARKSAFQYLDSKTFVKMINTNLHAIQESLKLNLVSPITSYFSRHSVASIMSELDISKDTISLCLGHSDVEQNLRTTNIYIAKDFEKIDIANRELIDFINSDCLNGKAWKEYKEKLKTTKTNPIK